MIKTGQAWAGLFVTLDATGAASAADSAPTGTLYVDGVSNAASVTITGSNPYKFAVTLPTLTAGQRVDMYITATIDTIATAGIVASAQADTVLLSDGVTLADDAITAASLKADAVTKIQNGLATSSALATVDGIVDDILVDTSTTLDGKLNTIVGATTATGVLLKDTAIEAIFNDVVVTGTYTFAQLMKIMASALAGKLSGGGTTTLTFKSVDGASDVIEAIVDANGNRTSVTLTV